MAAICTFERTKGVGLTNETDNLTFFGILIEYTVTFDDGSIFINSFALDILKSWTKQERDQYITDQLTAHLIAEFPAVPFTLQDMKEL